MINTTQSPVQPDERDKLVIGADVIAYLNHMEYPMIMVDKILYYGSKPLYLLAERYVSANEPAFTGHFPTLKLWPGVYTIEGLRQTCNLLKILKELEDLDLLDGLLELHNRQTLKAPIDHELCRRTMEYLKNVQKPAPDLFSVRIKLLKPVFAGSVISYYCQKDDRNASCFSVKGFVDESLVAEGVIVDTSR